MRGDDQASLARIVVPVLEAAGFIRNCRDSLMSSSPDVTGGGYFGAKYAAAPIGSPDEGLKDSRQRVGHAGGFDRRLSLADKLNRQFHERYPNSDVKAYEELYEAVALMNLKDLTAFDLARDGRPGTCTDPGRFAQGCLLARRWWSTTFALWRSSSADGTPIMITSPAWRGRCNEFDQAYAALITD